MGKIRQQHRCRSIFSNEVSYILKSIRTGYLVDCGGLDLEDILCLLSSSSQGEDQNPKILILQLGVDRNDDDSFGHASGQIFVVCVPRLKAKLLKLQSLLSRDLTRDRQLSLSYPQLVDVSKAIHEPAVVSGADRECVLQFILKTLTRCVETDQNTRITYRKLLFETDFEYECWAVAFAGFLCDYPILYIHASEAAQAYFHVSACEAKIEIRDGIQTICIIRSGEKPQKVSSSNVSNNLSHQDLLVFSVYLGDHMLLRFSVPTRTTEQFGFASALPLCTRMSQVFRSELGSSDNPQSNLEGVNTQYEQVNLPLVAL